MPAVLTVKIEDRLKASAESLKKSVEEIGLAAQKVVGDSATKLDFKLIALSDHAGMLGKKLQEIFSLESALRSFSSGLDADIAKMREAGASAQDLQDALARKAVVDVDLTSVAKLSQAFQGIIEKTRRDFNQLLATGGADVQAFASQGLKQKVESVATGAVSTGVRQVRDELRFEAQPRDRDRADRTAEARRLAQESAINARRSSSEAQRAAGSEREMAEIKRQIALNEGLASSNAEVAKSLTILKQQLQDKDDQMRMSLALAERYGKQSDMDRAAAEGLVKQGIAKKSRPYIDNQFEEQERAKREAASRGVSSGTTSANRSIEEQRRNLQGLRQDIAAAQAQAEQTLARSNKMFAQAGQMQVQISDLRSYIQQLERIKKPTAEQIKQVEEWKLALDDLVKEQEKLRQGAEKTADSARFQTTVARGFLDRGQGVLPDADQTKAKARQATLEVGGAASAAKNLRLETRANAESLGLVGRFLDAVGDKAQRNRKILIDIAQAYLINTRAGNEAFNAIQRAAASGGEGMLARVASSPVALPALLGTIVAAGAAVAAYKGNARAMRDMAAAGDAAAEGGLRKVESRSFAVQGSLSQLLVSMRRGTDQTYIFGSAFRFLASTAESAKGGVSSLLLTLAGARGSGELAAELYESRKVGREQAYDVRREQRGKAGSISVGAINNSADLRSELDRVKSQIANSQDGKFIREVLNPRLIALEGRVADLKSQSLARYEKTITEKGKLVQTEVDAEQQIRRLNSLLQTAKGPDVDKVLTQLKAYRERVVEIKMELLAATTAVKKAWQDLELNRNVDRIKAFRSTDEIDAEKKAIDARVKVAQAGKAQLTRQSQGLDIPMANVPADATPEQAAKIERDHFTARVAEAKKGLRAIAKAEQDAQREKNALQQQEQSILGRFEQAQSEKKIADEQHRNALAVARLSSVRDMDKLLQEEADLEQQILVAERGSVAENELLTQQKAVQNRQREIAVGLVQAEVAAERELFDASLRATEAQRQRGRQEARDRGLGAVERRFGFSVSAGSFAAAKAPLGDLEQAQQQRLAELAAEKLAVQAKLAQAAKPNSGTKPEEVSQLQRELQQAEQETDQLRSEIQKSQTERIASAQQKAFNARTLADAENRALRATQFDLGEKRLEQTAGKENMQVETARERAQLMVEMQKALDRAAGKAEEAATELERLELAGQGATDEATKMRIELERQAQLAADIAQRLEQQRNAEREMLLIVRAKEQEKRDAAAKEAMGNLRAAGRLDPLTALGRSINQQQVGRQVLADRRGEVNRLIGEGLSPEDARRQVFKRQVSDEEQLNAKQRLGQGRIDELERRGAISQQTASQLREQLNAEAEGIRQQIRLRVATEDLTRAIRGVNKLGPNQAPIEGANPNKVQGLLGDIADDPRKKERRQAFQQAQNDREFAEFWRIEKNRKRRARKDPVDPNKVVDAEGNFDDDGTLQGDDWMAAYEKSQARRQMAERRQAALEKQAETRRKVEALRRGEGIEAPAYVEPDGMAERRRQAMEREAGYKARAQELIQGGGRRQMPQPPAQGPETAQASTDAISTMFQYLQQTMAADVEQAKILEAMTSQYQGLLQALSNQASTTRGKAARSIS